MSQGAAIGGRARRARPPGALSAPSAQSRAEPRAQSWAAPDARRRLQLALGAL